MRHNLNRLGRKTWSTTKYIQGWKASHGHMLLGEISIRLGKKCFLFIPCCGKGIKGFFYNMAMRYV